MVKGRAAISWRDLRPSCDSSGRPELARRDVDETLEVAAESALVGGPDAGGHLRQGQVRPGLQAVFGPLDAAPQYRRTLACDWLSRCRPLSVTDLEPELGLPHQEGEQARPDQALGLAAEHVADPAVLVAHLRRPPVVTQDRRRQRFPGLLRLSAAVQGHGQDEAGGWAEHPG